MKTKLLLSLSFILLLNSCSLNNAYEMPRESGFLDYSGTADTSEMFPFDYIWISPNIGEIKGKEVTISVKVIPSEYLDDSAWKLSMSPFIKSEKEYFSYIDEVASRFEKTLIESLNKRSKELNPDRKTDLATNEECTTDNCLNLDMAFSEVVFGDPIPYAATMAIPFPGVSYVLDSVSSPMASIEAKISKNDTKEEFIRFADKKFPKIKIFDLNKFTIKSPLHEITDRWVTEVTESMFIKPDERIKKTMIFGILPW